MLPISCQLPLSPSTPQTIARGTVCCSRSRSRKSRTADGRTISKVPASPLVYPGNKTLISTLSDYRVCQLAKGAMQVGNSLMRSVAGFAFQQVMESPEIGLVCPGLKESLVVLLALPTLVSGYPQKKCEDGKVWCDSTEACHRGKRCDGIEDCNPPYDEVDCIKLSQCEVKDDFLCPSRMKCVPSNKMCDSVDDCGDLSDEYYWRCGDKYTPQATETSPPTVLTPESSTGDTSLPAYDRYLHASPLFVVLGICCASAATFYCISVYRSVKALRSTNPEASTRQLIQMAIRQLHNFRHQHQPVPIDAHEDAMVPPASPGHPGQSSEAQQASCQQATELPTQANRLPTYQQATGLPAYQQIIREAPPTYEEAIAETRG
ncbi:MULTISPECIES: low-density lipoprotein receptor class A repeat-containing protein [unclassified Endozoicomonas]|uniref:low-density lipoprotein receptor class A repeat-containing protein n=1 Tax=unclassified Endozoicomonas TaxID=2644528 RepID=UPI003BB7BC7C